MMISSSDDGVQWTVPHRIPIAPLGSTTEVMLPGLGIDPARLFLVDGSGLSRMDHIAPDQLTALLIAARSRPWFGTHKVLRGGCWLTRARLLRNTYRNFYRPDRRDVWAGFRTCALDV